MSEAGSSFDNFDDEQDGERFTIQPYQFEPRINSDEAESKACQARSLWKATKKVQILDLRIQTGM